MSTEKILKVTFEYENEIRWLEGEEAQKWLDAANSATVMEHIHGRPFPEFKWKSKEK